MQDKTERNKDRYRALWIAKRFWQIEHGILKLENVYRSDFRNSNSTGQGIMARTPIDIWTCETCKQEYRTNELNGLCFKCKKKGEQFFELKHKKVNRTVLDPTLYPAISTTPSIEIQSYQILIPNETRTDEDGTILFEFADNEVLDLYPENYRYMCKRMLEDGVSLLMKQYEDLVQPVALYQWDKDNDSYRMSRSAERKNLQPLAKWFVDNFDELRVKVVVEDKEVF